MENFIFCAVLLPTFESYLPDGFYYYYKPGEPLLLKNGAEFLQIGEAITNWGRFVTNRSNYCTVHCVKSVRIRSYSCSYFPAFGLNTDQNNFTRSGEIGM